MYTSARMLCLLTTRLLLSLVVFGGRVLSTPRVEPQDIEGAASEPKAVAVAEPNLGALLGIGTTINQGNHAALLQGLGAQTLPQAGGGIQGAANLQALRDSGALGNICNNNNNNGGPNSDALTNLLVYQYLSGSIPGGAQNGLGAPNVAAVNPQLQALLEGSRESKTKTSVTTTLTIRTVTMEPSTKFSTDTTSYVTTITSLTSSVLPIIFRGSKITTTITDKKTEVLTATEFHTSSSVLTPSIIQTLNVEVTLTETSTKGLNGHYTLAQVTPGASKIIEQPISSSNIDFDTQGLDLASLDLASLDLVGIRGIGKGGEKSNVVKALTALLKQYDDSEPAAPSAPRGRGRERERNRDRKRDRDRNVGNTRFHTRSRFSPETDEPKFNVIRGFTLSDRPESRKSDSGGSAGTALTNTRYSKFRKKNNVENNSLRATEPDRENERFSASTSRRTVSRANRNRETTVQGRSRFQQTSPSDSSSAPRGRTNRQIERSRRRSGRNLRTEIRTPQPITIQTDRVGTRTTVLTMFISGAKPGDTITTTRTVTLRGVADRVKRDVTPKPTVPNREPILNTEIPDLTQDLGSEKVIRLLKELDKSSVRKMLHSLHDWVNYYLHQVLDETIEPSFLSRRYNDITSNDITELYSSKIEEESSSSQDATTSLVSLPNAITGDPDISSSTEVNICPKVSVSTETVYQTISVTAPH